MHNPPDGFIISPDILALQERQLVVSRHVLQVTSQAAQKEEVTL